MAYTKGNWKKTKNEDGGWDIIKLDKSLLPGRIYIARDTQQGADDGESDATLLECSPEMFEILQQINAAFDTYAYHRNNKGRAAAKLKAWNHLVFKIDTAREIIQKARS